MTSSQIIVLATPVFLLLIAAEFAWGYAKGRNTYRLGDAVNSISLGMLSQLGAVFTPLLAIGIYRAVYSSLAIYPDAAFWNQWYGWLLALVFYDFCYYWLHRAGHESAVFWAAHVVHHQSQDYNLSTALRQTGSGVFLGWIFYIPMAVAGVPPLLFALVALVDLLYQFWVHTEHVPKLGWFDRWFCSPSNHRVHHAVNDNYLDKNYGGILIVWDRLFGSFREEGERCVYGTRSPLNSWDPLWANAEVYWTLAKDSWHAQNWLDKIRVWFKSPGWRPADVAARFPHAAFDITQVQRFQPPLRRATIWFAGLQFVVVLQGVAAFLWLVGAMSTTQKSIWFVALLAGLWSVGAVLQGRLGLLQVLLIESAVLATATAALDLSTLHQVFKPLTLLIAIAWVVARVPKSTPSAGFYRLLLTALTACLVGDICLMFDGGFIPGLLSFLLAHVFYLALFRQGVTWFPNRRALIITLATGLAMYAFLWPSLNPLLKVAVAAYVLVISLMAAQAIGRATVLRDHAPIAVAAGAGLFMLSDALLASNRFVYPLPLASLWVLATYYLAQILIVSQAHRSALLPTSGHKQV
jgi:alkylglycerol monooxygenase